MNNLNVKAPTIKLSVDVQSMLAGGSPNLKSLFNYFLICVALFNIVYVPTYLPTYVQLFLSEWNDRLRRRRRHLNKNLHKIKIDQPGLKAHQDRKANGFRLFGKYYQGLWDWVF